MSECARNLRSIKLKTSHHCQIVVASDTRLLCTTSMLLVPEKSMVLKFLNRNEILVVAYVTKVIYVIVRVSNMAALAGDWPIPPLV